MSARAAEHGDAVHCKKKEKSFKLKRIKFIFNFKNVFGYIPHYSTCPVPLQSWPGWSRAVVQLSGL